MVAAKNGRTKVIEAILKDDGWDLNEAIFTHSPQTAVDFAAAEGQADAVTWLMHRGAKLHSSKELGDESRLAMLADDRSMNPVRRDGLIRVARLYIDRGEDVNKQLYSSRATPLHLAARQSFPEMIALLVSRGANVSVLDEHGRTPLDLAKTAACAACVANLRPPPSKP
jgi:ankyrin repeat protein